MTWYEILPRILNMSLTASVIICFVLLGRLILKRSPKIYSYVLWSVVLFRLLFGHAGGGTEHRRYAGAL